MAKWLTMSLAALTVLAIGTTTGEAQDKEKKVKRDRTMILPDEIAEKPDLTNAYEAIQRLRPQWLKSQRSRLGSGSGANASEGYRPDSPGASNRSGETQSPETGRVAPPSVGGGGGGTTAVFYLDEVKQPELEDLRNIRVAEIVEIKYMNGTEATGRYGEGHSAGAIMVKTNRLGR